MRTCSYSGAVFAAGVLFLGLGSLRAAPPDSAADAAWARVQEPLAFRQEKADGSAAYVLRREESRLRYRVTGLEFFDAFPDDPRRWEWFLFTQGYAPRYWRPTPEGADLVAKGHMKHAEVDAEAKAKWDAVFAERLVPAFLASPQPTAQQRRGFHGHQLNEIYDRRSAVRPGGQSITAVDVHAYVEQLALFAANTKADDWISIEGYCGKLKRLIILAGLDDAAQAAIFARLGQSPHAALRGYAEGLLRMAELRRVPMELSLVTMEGKPLEVSSLRGKVVLVDLWSTSCTSCIEAMPGLKRIHDRLRPAGFEVVSVCMDFPKNREKVGAIVARIGASWPTAFVDLAPKYEETPLIRRFAITSVPVYFLLDQTGRLIGTDYIGTEGEKRLEQDVEKLLANPGMAAR